MYFWPVISNKKILSSIVIIVFLVSINFSTGQYLRPELDKILYADQINYLSIATTFQKTGVFSDGVVSNNISYYENGFLQSHFLPPEGSWTPLYFVFLALYYQLMGILPQDSLYYGSLFNNILGSIFLTLFFLLIKSRFNLQIAFFSSLLVSLVPFFNEQTAMISPYLLMYIFSISALFFLDKRKSHYFLFGIFIGLAHLTHGFAIFLGFSYCLFLLINREFKGFAITSVTWLLVILPWMLRNYYVFRNFGEGLYIPFSSKLSDVLSHVLHQKIVVAHLPDYAPTSTAIPGAFSVFANSFNEATDELSGHVSIVFLIAFILIFTGFAFFKLQKLRPNSLYLIILILAVLYIRGYGYFDGYTQLFFVFIFPASLFYLIYRYKRYIFEIQIPRIQRFVILLSFISLIGFFYFSWYTGSDHAPTKMLMFSIFLLIPLAIEGLIKIIRKLIPQNRNKFLKIIPVIVIAILLPIMIQSVYGIVNGIGGAYSDTKYFYREDGEIYKTNVWVGSHIPENTVVGSNLPLVTVDKTGLASMKLEDTVNRENFEDLLHINDIKYLIFYETNVYGSKTTYDNVKNWSDKNFLYSEVYSNGNSHVVKVSDLFMTADITNPILYIFKAQKLEHDGNMMEANKIYDEIKEFKTNDLSLSDDICHTLTIIHKYELATYKCNLILDENKFDWLALHELALNSETLGKHENVLAILNEFKVSQSQTPHDVILLDSWIDTINDLMYDDPSYEYAFSSLLENAKELENQGDMKGALVIYEKTKYIPVLEEVSFESELRVLSMLGNEAESIARVELQKAHNAYAQERLIQIKTVTNRDAVQNLLQIKSDSFDNALKSYDESIDYFQKAFEESHEPVRDIIQKSLIDALDKKGNLLVELDRYNDANDVYLKITELDMFDKSAHEKRSMILEKLGMTDDAKRESDFAKRLG